MTQKEFSLLKNNVGAENYSRRDDLPKSDMRFQMWTVNLTIIFIVVVGGILIYQYVEVFGSEILKKQDVWGQFGDYFGGVMNPLIGMFTLVLLLQNLDLQRKLLRQTREQVNIAKEEYKLTREELERSATALVEQSAILRQQAKEAESRFLSQKDDEWYFQLLKMRSEMIDKLTVGLSGEQLVGAKCFGKWVLILVSEHIQPMRIRGSSITNAQYVEAVRELLSLHTNSLYPYLRFMESLIASIGHHDPTDESGRRKHALLATQLGEWEATLLGCYAITLDSPTAVEQMRKLGVIGTKLTTLRRNFEVDAGTKDSDVYEALLDHLHLVFNPKHLA
jgi:hypothetical protein